MGGWVCGREGVLEKLGKLLGRRVVRKPDRSDVIGRMCYIPLCLELKGCSLLPRMTACGV